MKKKLSGALVGLMLMLGMGGANAAPAGPCYSSIGSLCFVNFIEGSETDPVTVLASPGVVASPGYGVSDITSESATVTGTLAAAALTDGTDIAHRTGSIFAVLFEPGNIQNLVSDYLVLTFAAPTGMGDAKVQGFRLEFVSEDIMLDVLTARLESRTDLIDLIYGGGVLEDGTLQDLSTLLVSGIAADPWPSDLFVSAQSDVERIPEPTSVALLGLALAGLGWSRRRKA